MKKILVVCVLNLLLFATVRGQENEITIKFIGNCGLYLTDGTIDLYVDFPYKSGAYGYMEFEDNQLDSIQENAIFLFTHKHADHYSGKNIRKTIRQKGGNKYGKWNLKQLKERCDSTTHFSIEWFETPHRFSLTHYSFLLTWHGKRIYFSGDTEYADTILTVKDLDWAFVPTWVVVDANTKEKQIDAKWIGVYHLYPNEVVTNNSPKSIKVLDTQGEVFLLKY